MSEYQYYEFQAIDRPLSGADQETLRALSTRARITATSFTNSYEWGDFKGDPAWLMENWFDLHLYLANWGSRRLMIRWPARLVDRHLLGAFLGEVDCAELRSAGQNLILDIAFDEVAFEDWDDGSGWLAALGPLRADVLGGDLRLFYLLWLSAVEADVFEPDEPEPMPGIGPMTGALEAFAEFFDINRDLVAAAAERAADPLAEKPESSEAVRPVVVAMTDPEKTAFLTRLFDGDAHVGSELRALVRRRLLSATHAAPVAARTVGDLRARAEAIWEARERALAEKAAAERKRREEEAERSRRARLDAIVRRGESVWREIETEIERRNAAGYDKATSLLLDLKTISREKGTHELFIRRLQEIRDRHARKERLIERLAKLG
ncbi:MAG TPA: hypothetical protein ENH55_09110 [Aurantimonas coralicida]|uniref:Uncharacterized protein n=2 Tax=root TaxID=1 RepID=A0A9C9NL30_9HYPH|nr:hypothetical protein [Aurantimonas coralicida]HEU03054.1 hypothetical protein [Aurantimonas coralicida]